MNFDTEKLLDLEGLEPVSEKFACAFEETEFSASETNAEKRRNTFSRDKLIAALCAQPFDF